MRHDPLSCATCEVRDRAACAALRPDQRADLARLGHRRQIARGEIVFAAGAPVELAATLTRGLLKVVSTDDDGVEHIVSLIHPAGFAGELFRPEASYDVVAATDCDLCVFPRDRYEGALEQFPELGQAMLRRSADDLAETRALLASVTRRTAMERVAAFLLAMGRAANDTECHPARRFDLILTRGEMASLLGLTIETVSRQLSALERQGLIRRSGRRMIELIDPARLAALA